MCNLNYGKGIIHFVVVRLIIKEFHYRKRVFKGEEKDEMLSGKICDNIAALSTSNPCTNNLIMLRQKALTVTDSAYVSSNYLPLGTKENM